MEREEMLKAFNEFLDTKYGAKEEVKDESKEEVKTDTKTEETTEDKPADTSKDDKTENADTEVKTEDNGEEKVEETEETTEEDTTEETNENKEEVFIDANDIVLKSQIGEYIQKALEPIMARFEASDKTVKDMVDTLGDIKNRFIGDDFGDTNPSKGDNDDVMRGDNFDSYSKQFMNK